MAMTLVLVLSVVLGESLSTKVFGTLKNVWLYLLDITLFVGVLVVVLNNVSTANIYTAVPVYFASGFLTIVCVRGLTTLLGFGSGRVAEKRKRSHAGEEQYVENIGRNLKRYNLKDDEIKEVLLNSGFKKKVVEKRFRNK